jgi:hypothetical protein
VCAGPGSTTLRALQLKEEQLWGAEVELDQLLAATALTEEQVRAANASGHNGARTEWAHPQPHLHRD